MRKIALVPALCAAVALAGIASAALGGPTPGIAFGSGGVLAPDGAVRFVPHPAGGGRTSVAKIRVADSRVLARVTLSGVFGVPVVAFDGTREGVSADGKTLLLGTAPAAQSARPVSRFAVLSTATLRPRRMVALPGVFAFDALSPDARTAYLIESDPGRSTYRVRALDLVSGRLVPGAIVDKREADEPMQGSPVTRSTSPDRGWAYTLYARNAGHGFVHALDTRHRAAVCVDLPWRVDLAMGVRMSTTADGSQLVLRQPAVGTLATIDTGSFQVHAVRSPVAPGA